MNRMLMVLGEAAAIVLTFAVLVRAGITTKLPERSVPAIGGIVVEPKQQAASRFDFRLEVDSANRRYQVGENIVARVISEKDG